MLTDITVDEWIARENKRLVRVTDAYLTSHDWEQKVVEAITSGHVGVVRLM